MYIINLYKKKNRRTSHHARKCVLKDQYKLKQQANKKTSTCFLLLAKGVTHYINRSPFYGFWGNSLIEGPFSF